MGRAGYESAPYTTLHKDGDFEIREYPEMNIVETSESREGPDSGFRRLFGYITGANEDKQKIAMTTPVYMQEKTHNMMAFVMPAGMKFEHLPLPTNGSVHKSVIEGGLFATYTSTGSRSQQFERDLLQRLEKWLKEYGVYEYDSN